MRFSMKNFMATKFRFLFLLLLTCPQLAEAQEGKRSLQERMQEGEKIKNALWPALQSPDLMDYHLAPDFKWIVPRFGGVPLPDEQPLHAEGVFYQGQVKANLFGLIDPPSFGLSGKSNLRLIYGNKVQSDESQALKSAVSFAKPLFPGFFAEEITPHVSSVNEDGIVEVLWRTYRPDGLPDLKLSIFVRLMDLKVVTFATSKLVGEWEHKISPSEAQKTAIAYASTSKVQDVKIVEWNVSGGGGHRYYVIGLEGHNENGGERVSTSVSVDAATGTLDSSIDGWMPVHPQKSKFAFEDTLPVWTKSGLLFTSSRPIGGMPKWSNLGPQALLRTPQSQIFHVTQDFEDSPRYISGLQNSSWVAIDRGTWTYALDLETGGYKMLGHLRREGSDPAVAPDGANSVIIWDRGSENDRTQDLFADNLKNRNAWPNVRSRLVASHDQGKPVFSPDGNWLYFASVSVDKNSGQVTTSIDRLPRESVNRGKPMIIARAGDVPTNPQKLSEGKIGIIADLPGHGPIERLSVFPSGKQLLAQANNEIFLIKIGNPTGKVTPLKLPKLVDAQVGSPLSDIRDAWAGPGEDEITFSAATKDAKGLLRKRIYSCAFDGSSLKAWTPQEASAVPTFKFPQGNLDAEQLARDWA
ncbi:hypothetical protein EON80_11560, partial [bacterium]